MSPRMLHLSTALAAAALLSGCHDTTGPSMPDSLRPEFQKVYQGGGTGGHGGGASGSGAVCEYPKHWSAECESKLIKARGTLVFLGPCIGGPNVACTGGAYTSGHAWSDYYETPGADGIPYDPYPGPYQPNYGCYVCTTRNDPPFNPIPGGGYSGGYQ